MSPPQPSDDLRREFGDIDIYLFDQLHRGRIRDGMSILDAGCGGGRNLVYSCAEASTCSARMQTTRRSARVRQLAISARARAAGRPFPRRASRTHVVFRRDVRRRHQQRGHAFRARRAALARDARRDVARPEAGRTVLRASRDDDRTRVAGQARWPADATSCPTATSAFSSMRTFIMLATRTVGGELLDPLKTSVVQNTRSMMTWVMRKAVSP